MSHDPYWLTLLQGAHIEARLRQRKDGRRNPPQRVQETIDRIRLEQGLEPLYQEKAA